MILSDTATARRGHCGTPSRRNPKALTANFGIRIAATKCLQSFLCYSRALKIDVLQFREIRKCDDSAVRNLPAIPNIENLQIREEYEMLRQFFEIFISNRMARS